MFLINGLYIYIYIYIKDNSFIQVHELAIFLLLLCLSFYDHTEWHGYITNKCVKKYSHAKNMLSDVHNEEK